MKFFGPVLARTFLFLSLLFVPFAHSSAAVDADVLVKIGDRVRGLQSSFSMQVAVTDFDGDEKTSSEYIVYVNDDETSLVEQMIPERLRGRKLLMKDVDLWLYTPSIKRPVRVSVEQRLTGEVSNGDLARTNFAADYSATVEKEEKIGKEMAYKLKLEAKKKGVTYKNIDYWLSKDKKLPMKANFYALSGKLLKTAVYSDYKKSGKMLMLTKTVFTDAIQKKKRSILIYSNQKKEKFSDAFFNRESLEK